MLRATNFYLQLDLVIINLFTFLGSRWVKDYFESTFQLNYKCIDGEDNKDEIEDEEK